MSRRTDNTLDCRSQISGNKTARLDRSCRLRSDEWYFRQPRSLNGADPDKEIRFVPARPRLRPLRRPAAKACRRGGDLAAVGFRGGKSGYNVLARAYLNYPLSGLGVNAKSLQQNRHQVKRAIKALIRASRFIRDNREAVKILITWAKPNRNTPMPLTTPL